MSAVLEQDAQDVHPNGKPSAVDQIRSVLASFAEEGIIPTQVEVGHVLNKGNSAIARAVSNAGLDWRELCAEPFVADRKAVLAYLRKGGVFGNRLADGIEAGLHR